MGPISEWLILTATRNMQRKILVRKLRLSAVWLLNGVLIACSCSGLFGCKKKEASNSSTVSNQAVVGSVDPMMTAELRKFIDQQHRLPNNLWELLNRFDQRPHPPQGMQWVIDGTTKEVKLVKQ